MRTPPDGGACPTGSAAGWSRARGSAPRRAPARRAPTAIITITAATPMMMPSMVSALRSLFTASARIATRSRPRTFMPAPAPRAACASASSRLRRCAWSSTRCPSRKRRTRRAKRATSGSCVTSTTVMPLAVEFLQQRHDLQAGARVERAGRLVGEDQQRARDQRARDRHALLLAAGELRRLVVGALGEPDLAPASRARARGAPRAGDARVDQRQLDVLERRGAREQVEVLEHEADAAVAHRGELVAGEVRDAPAAEAYSPELGRSRQPSRFMKVDLPEPEGPITATNSPCAMSTLTPGERAATSLSPIR